MVETIHVSAERMWKIAYDALLLIGVDEEQAKNGADVLNKADLRGVDTHGIARLNHYANLVARGVAQVAPDVRLVKDGPVAAVLDTDRGLGICTAPAAMEIAIEKARTSGVGMCSMIHMTHCGIQGYYPLMCSDRDLIGLCFVKTGPNSAPYGGKGFLLGNSPHSIAFPAGHRTPGIMFDMATTVVAGGKVEMAQRDHRQIPLDWILDDNGRPTSDPFAFEHRKHGSLQLIAAHKGYCLTVIVELLAAILSGMDYEGALMMCIDPTIIRPLDELKTDLDTYFDKIKNSPRRDDVDEIFLPGEIEYKNELRARIEGIDLRVQVAEEVLALYKKLGGVPASGTIHDLFN